MLAMCPTRSRSFVAQGLSCFMSRLHLSIGYGRFRLLLQKFYSKNKDDNTAHAILCFNMQVNYLGMGAEQNCFL